MKLNARSGKKEDQVVSGKLKDGHQFIFGIDDIESLDLVLSEESMRLLLRSLLAWDKWTGAIKDDRQDNIHGVLG